MGLGKWWKKEVVPVYDDVDEALGGELKGLTKSSEASAGTALGAAMGGPVGGAFGAWVGSKLGGALGDSGGRSDYESSLMNMFNEQQKQREAAIQKGLSEGQGRAESLFGRTEKDTGADVSGFLGKQKQRAMGESAAFGAIDRAKSEEIAATAKQSAREGASGSLSTRRMVEAKRRASQNAALAKNKLEAANLSDYGRALQGVYSAQMNLPLAHAALKLGGQATPPTPEKRGLLSGLWDKLGI